MTLPLDHWETLCREASPAPWTGKHDIIWAHIDEEEIPVQCRDTPVAVVSSCANDPCEEGFTPEQAARNRDFILAAREALPALIQEVRRLRSLIDSSSFICTKCDSELSWHPEDPPHADYCVWYKAP